MHLIMTEEHSTIHASMTHNTSPAYYCSMCIPLLIGFIARSTQPVSTIKLHWIVEQIFGTCYTTQIVHSCLVSSFSISRAVSNVSVNNRSSVISLSQNVISMTRNSSAVFYSASADIFRLMSLM